VKPLDDLRSLLSRLADREFNVVAVEGAYPVLRPLLENYNYLVTRLAELEEAHRSRADSLEQEVRAAAQTLLEQQRTIARAERLAALGEMAGILAHEVRNPLAGILMGLTNLRRDVGEPELVARIEVLTAEIDRLARLLTGFLAGARHAPEPLRELDVRALATELLALIRYQIPESLRLECRIPAEIRCRLPRDRLRQALLNLVLNSVRAMQDATGTIAISAERANGKLVLSVCDEGSGFPVEMLSGGPQPFVSWRDGGTGLGLAIVRRVVGDLAGELRLENRRPRGACVHLILPIDRG
jgi:two-component system NtrC family sensor kinase